MEPTDIDLRISRILENEASAEDLAVVKSACAADPGLRRRFARETQLQRITGALIEGRDGDARFAAEVVSRLQASPAITALPDQVETRLRQQLRLSRWGRGLALAAAVALVAGLVVFPSFRGGATLFRCESVVWIGAGANAGDFLGRGRIVEIVSGLAELRFPAGVTVLLEGPARLKVTGDKSAVLDHGRLVAHVTHSKGKGFVIDGPSGRIVDLGTAFGVSVDPSGEMEVHVLEGSVNASSKRDNGPAVELFKDEAMRLGAGAAERIPADNGAFVTDLPPLPGRSPAYVRWSFEETSGNALRNSGKALAEDLAAAELLTFPDGRPGATRIDGRFGRALAFDGVDDYVESGFDGVVGQAPRTVALWAKVPADLARSQSYAMIGWGRVEGRGSAWQISANPMAADGPVGALRAGTGQAAVVGSTDLRDGRWHHLAAVMYGGDAPSTATHVLLYVDGQLESTTRKSVRVINTEPATDPHGVWLGRKLSVINADPADAFFFRGQLDEVHIFADALDQPMIRRVMEGGSPES